MALPEVAVGLIVAEDGRLLLQHRDDKPGIINPGRWGCFGGHVDPGERAAHAFVREMDEELGWRPSHFEPYRRLEVDSDGWHLMSNTFAAHLDVPPEALRQTEGQGLGLFAPDALPEGIVGGIVPLIREFAASDAYRRVRKRWDVITATGIIVDGDGRFLLQLRDDKPGIDNPGMWGSFGGRIEPGETPADGFVRELREELGWAPSRCELFAAGAYRPDERNQLIYVYAARLDVPPEALVLGEGQALGLFAPDELPGSTVPDYAALLRRFAASELYARLRDGA
jgi:8-oxo-dGTP diphosphatase